MEYQQRVALGESFTNLPWLTDTFRAANLLEKITGCTEIEAFAKELERGEHDFHSPAFLAIKKYLAGGHLTQNETRAGVGCLMSYRLVDIAIWRHTLQNPPKCEVKSKDCVLFRNPAFKALRTWTALVSDAYKSSLQVTEGSITRGIVDEDHPFVLHTMIDECKKTSGFYAILGNFAKAAFHLQYLLKGFNELPGTALQIANDLKLNDHPDFPIFRTRKVDIHRIRNALYLALMSTPMCLLSMTQVDSIFHAALHLADSFVSLNSNRPEPLLQVDAILWNLLFDTARGKVSLYDGLLVALKNANAVLTQIDPGASHWYSSEFERCLPPAPPTAAPTLVLRPRAEAVREPSITKPSVASLVDSRQSGSAGEVSSLTRDERAIHTSLAGLKRMELDSDVNDDMMEVDQFFEDQYDDYDHQPMQESQWRRFADMDMDFGSHDDPGFDDEEVEIRSRKATRFESEDGHEGNDENERHSATSPTGQTVDKGDKATSGEEMVDDDEIAATKPSKRHLFDKDGKRVRRGTDESSASNSEVNLGGPKKKRKVNQIVTPLSSDRESSVSEAAPSKPVTVTTPVREEGKSGAEEARRRSTRLQTKENEAKSSEAAAVPPGAGKPKAKRLKKKKKTTAEKDGQAALGSKPPGSTATTAAPDSEKDSSSDDEIVFLGRRMKLGVEFKDLYADRTPRVKVELDDTVPSFERDTPESSNDDEPMKSPTAMPEFPRVVGDKPIHQYDASTGAKRDYLPQFHYDAELQLLYAVEKASEKTHVDGQPAYFALHSEQSFIHRMSYKEYLTLDMKTMLEIFRRKHILVYGKPDKNHKFDADSLEDVLGNLRRPCTIQDLSIPADSDFSVRLRDGCAMDILNSHRQGGRSLNGLDFRRSFDWDSDQKKKLETDMIAWTETEQLVLCPITHNFPITDMRWAMAATSGCYSHIHIDSSGFAMCVECLVGKKDWFVGIPKEGEDYNAFSSLGTFTGDYDFRGINESRFRWEKLTLDSTTLFFQRPGTPHIVFTLEASLVRGRFFYSTSCLRETVTAYYHDCIQHSIITNSEHQEASIIILSRILAMYNSRFVWDDEVVCSSHLPDLSTFDGVFDVLTLCAFFEVSNALMKWGSDDAANIRLRHFLIRSRKRGRELVAWISHKYAFVQDIETVNCLNDIYWPYVAKVACLVYRYQQASDRYRNDGSKIAPNTLRILRQSFRDMDPVKRLFELTLMNRKVPQTFAWTGPPTVVKVRSDMGKFVRSSVEGLNADDMDAGLTRRHVHFEEKRYYSSARRTKEPSKTPAPVSSKSAPTPSPLEEDLAEESEQSELSQPPSADASQSEEEEESGEGDDGSEEAEE